MIEDRPQSTSGDVATDGCGEAIAALSRRLTDLELRARRLDDIAAIQNMIASYGPLADSGNVAAAAALWTGDGIYRVPGVGEFVGLEGMSRLLTSAGHQHFMAQGSAHVLPAPHVTIDGDEATATGYSMVFLHQDGRFVVARVAVNRWKLVRTAQGWRVSERINRLLTGDAESLRLLGSLAAGKLADDARTP